MVFIASRMVTLKHTFRLIICLKLVCGGSLRDRSSDFILEVGKSFECFSTVSVT